MKIAGIISEFNPFHNGHEYIISRMKSENDAVISVMSGNYVQRGEPAIFDKFVRTEAALKSGVDLVAELPSPWSASFSENFAVGAISILKELNVENLYFGSECGKIDLLQKIADTEFTITDNKTETYASIRQKSLENSLGQAVENILNSPNDILAVQYINATKTLSFIGNLIPIKRVGAGHGDTFCGQYASGSYIREKILNNQDYTPFVPTSSQKIYNEAISSGKCLSLEKFNHCIINYLRRYDDFGRLPDIGNEGLENKIKSAVSISTDYRDLIKNIKTKRYTEARIRRLILSAFLNIDCSYLKKSVPYINILGMSSVGEKILKNVAKTTELPIIISMKSNKPLDKPTEMLLYNESKRNDIYASLLTKCQPCGLDYTNGIIKVRN